MRRLFISLVALFGVVSVSHAAYPEIVSLVRLIAAPREFDGKRVVVMGVPRIEFESNGLYLHREDFDQGLTKNALWLAVPEDKRNEWKALEGKYVLVEGTFNAENTGHFGIYSGSISKITRFQLLQRESPK